MDVCFFCRVSLLAWFDGGCGGVNCFSVSENSSLSRGKSWSFSMWLSCVMDMQGTMGVVFRYVRLRTCLLPLNWSTVQNFKIASEPWLLNAEKHGGPLDGVSVPKFWSEVLRRPARQRSATIASEKVQRHLAIDRSATSYSGVPNLPNFLRHTFSHTPQDTQNPAPSNQHDYQPGVEPPQDQLSFSYSQRN